MSDSGNSQINPYESPQTASIPEAGLSAQGALTDTMLRHLKDASPWMRFIGIVGYIGSGLVALIGIGFIVAMGTISSMWESLASELGSFGSIFSSLFSSSMGINILIAAVLLFFPAHFTYKAGFYIYSYIKNGREQELEIAFKNNKSLWKFSGIVTIIYLAFVPLLIIIVVIFTAIAAVSNLI